MDPYIADIKDAYLADINDAYLTDIKDAYLTDDGCTDDDEIVVDDAVAADMLVLTELCTALQRRVLELEGALAGSRQQCVALQNEVMHESMRRRKRRRRVHLGPPAAMQGGAGAVAVAVN